MRYNDHTKLYYDNEKSIKTYTFDLPFPEPTPSSILVKITVIRGPTSYKLKL
jgi:hypothetical protein